ncbi:tail fiber protein [Enterobacter asburiae]|uniref:Tail fiber protein n=1 Tax=Enterobacter asburiae TaxID=61645 RepID=A0A7W3DCV1_ENTAS|nr:tail fiber protein [Enterobacter asburiae]MBA8076240.1 tail fiber protein [Enterobacter asburiae]
MRPLMPPVQTPDNLFHDGNPLTGELGTIVDAEHLNNEQAAIRDTQSELIAILTAAAMEPESTAGQLLAALNKLYAPLNDTLGALSSLVGGANKLPYFTSANAAALTALSSIGRDIVGIATVADVLTYLGLGAGAPAVGIPFFWPHTQMPNNLVDDWNQMTFLKMNGSSFTAAAYPVLAKIWPGLVLPDFRGEFIRIWDDGRGIDSGRNLLTAQSFAMQNITGSFGEIADESKQYAVEINVASGAFQAQTYMRNIMRNPDFAARDAAVSITFDASRVAQTAAETRPRNISIGFIVRAK